MKLALEALIGAIEAAKTDVAHYAALDFDMCEDALQRGYAALEALAKQEQGEPVAEVGWGGTVNWHKGIPDFGTDLYTTPQQRKPLTDEQLKNHYQNNEWLDGVRFAEQFHGIKE